MILKTSACNMMLMLFNGLTWDGMGWDGIAGVVAFSMKTTNVTILDCFQTSLSI